MIGAAVHMEFIRVISYLKNLILLRRMEWIIVTEDEIMIRDLAGRSRSKDRPCGQSLTSRTSSRGISEGHRAADLYALSSPRSTAASKKSLRCASP